MLAGFAITSSAERIEIVTVDLLAGRDTPVGEIVVKIHKDGELHIKYKVLDVGEWELLDTHLYLGTDPPGKSAPGRFPYGPDDAVPAMVNGKLYTFVLPLFLNDEEVGPGATIYIAAHAEVRRPEIDPDTGLQVVDPDTGAPVYQEETAWAKGTDEIPPGKNWATFFMFTLPVQEEE